MGLELLSTAGPPPALAAGFADPVIEAQGVFRAVMDALARPGTLQPLTAALFPPKPLTPELAAVALALADHEAPLWLDDALRAAPAVAAYLRFHTGAALVDDPGEAAFALVVDPEAMPALDAFALGTPEYPDRSTTLVVAVRGLSDTGGFALHGPGIAGTARLQVSTLPERFAAQRRANRALFPRGVDCLFTAPGLVTGLPRSTALTGEG